MTNVDTAVEALTLFGCRTRAQAERALPAWPGRDIVLADDDVPAVLARFDGQPWPASIVWRDRP